jgi:uncharacterized membrane protein
VALTDNLFAFSMMGQLSIWAMALLFVLAGVNHFISPDFYLDLMPPYIPWHKEMVALSGVLEIIGGALVPTRYRRFAGWFLIALLVAIFPANIHATLKYAPGTDNLLFAVLLWLRLPFQGVLIWWVYRTCLSRPRQSR